MNPIKFGTDGWRAIIAADYTFENLDRVARATGQWLHATYGDDASVVVGYDCRFLGPEFAERAAQVFASMGIRAQLADSFVTTPAVSWATQAYGHSAGIVITASHNPPAYNGFKIKAHFGGPATPDMIEDVEAQLGQLADGFEKRPVAALKDDGLIERIDLSSAFTEVLAERIDTETIKASGLKFAYDAMYGAGQGTLTALLGAEQVVELHHDLNPGMHGQAPEPIDRNLGKLAQAVVDAGCAAGLATDGDADRIGMYDETGTFVDSHKILALLVKYLSQEKGLTGSVVKTFSTTDMLGKMADAYGLEAITTPIGFKYIGPKIVEGDVLVGGEESGGMAIKGHIPERDGLFIGLTVVEMMVKRKKTLSALVQELFNEFGEHRQSRNDLRTTEAKKQAFLKRLGEEGLSEIGGRPVETTETLDGYKFRVEGGWLMFRPSGTEPVLRIYSEATTQDEADALVAEGATMVG